MCNTPQRGGGGLYDLTYVTKDANIEKEINPVTDRCESCVLLDWEEDEEESFNGDTLGS